MNIVVHSDARSMGKLCTLNKHNSDQITNSDLPYYSRKVWQIDSFQVFGERKFGELIDHSIGY